METKEIRRLRLKEWFKDRTLPPKEKSYLSQLMSGKATFGEKAARRIEQTYGMPGGILIWNLKIQQNLRHQDLWH